ncbi:MAG: hypothetical protein U1E26_08185 [Coriobacteriia bacterium]|nr:hypothetical protein [Coriobacteriia bacterium]
MRPPTTYAEWSTLLDEYGRRSCGSDIATTLSEGSLEGGASSARRLLERIVEFENVALSRLVRGLERSLSMSPAAGYSDDVLTLVRRFSRDCDDLMFFRGLSFMPPEYIKELDEAVGSQVLHVLDEFLLHIDRESGQPPLDDLRFYVGRLRLRWQRGGCLGQLR